MTFQDTVRWFVGASLTFSQVAVTVLLMLLVGALFLLAWLWDRLSDAERRADALQATVDDQVNTIAQLYRDASRRAYQYLMNVGGN